MKKAGKIALILVIAIISIFALAVALLALNYGWWPSQGFPASEAKLRNPGYIPNSHLYLVSATAMYGTFHGEECFVINATIRSDYSANHPPPGGNGNSTTAFFGITATLYRNNAIVSATDIDGASIPPLGVPQYALDPNETGSIEINMATSNRNIDSYAITCVAVANSPIP